MVGDTPSPIASLMPFPDVPGFQICICDEEVVGVESLWEEEKTVPKKARVKIRPPNNQALLGIRPKVIVVYFP